ncbi:type I restriction enzyme S subunit [Nocardia kruczakiae]|uniref:Type I restriction enzyme S subunit n=2 Tax=Nocardia kruczakiae TaxID=261477 RepID=A0ABU1XMJ4_9NOCA|nr:type I restriction enzyme S subunit [Nocardia kruczakiae]
MGRKGTLGKVFYLDCDYWPHDTTLWVKDFKGNNPRFVYYFLTTLNFLAMDVGSSNPTLNRNHVHPLSILWPSLKGQQAIASILGALDDKIKVNDRIASTALELANLRYLVATEDSAKWRPVKLGSCARWLSGGTPSTSEDTFWGGHIPWISALSLKSPWITDSDRRLTALGASSGTKVVPPETVIFVVRGSSLKTEFRIGITQRDVAFGQDCKALIANEGIDAHLLFHAIRSKTPEILDFVDETSIGAGRLSSDLIANLEVLVPNSTADDIVLELRSLDALAARCEDESRALAALRDTLLPELMSGKLRIPDAEKIMENAL